ncbi:hypothetical protein LPJ60_004191 [Coemansia sp. RSA 2675]|nr:hypothetical protein LPJ60_004191 [Coemansia sp. RSA 2675]KAJ2001482.1 hypothetical protein GGI06_005823 [Coemansia sp. S85]
MRLPNLLFLFPLLAIASEPRNPVPRADAYSLATQLGKDFVDVLVETRQLTERFAPGVERARDDEDGESDETSKLVGKLASAFRPIMKEFVAVVNSILPAGPQRQLVKAAADAVDSLLPLILKYALGI